jgi:hypothetical protein
MLLDNNGRAIQIAIWVGNPQTANLSVTSTQVTLLPRTAYRIWSSVDAFFLFGTNPTATTVSHPLRVGLDVLARTDATNVVIAGIVASGTGVL